MFLLFQCEDEIRINELPFTSSLFQQLVISSSSADWWPHRSLQNKKQVDWWQNYRVNTKMAPVQSSNSCSPPEFLQPAGWLLEMDLLPFSFPVLDVRWTLRWIQSDIMQMTHTALRLYKYSLYITSMLHSKRNRNTANSKNHIQVMSVLRVGTSSPGLLRHQKNQTTQRSEVENRAPNPSNTTEPHTTRSPRGPWKLNRTAYRRIKTTSIDSCIYTGTNHPRNGSEPCLTSDSSCGTQTSQSFWRRVFVLIYILFKPSSRPDRGALKVQVHDEGRSTKTEEGLSQRNTVRTIENLLQQVWKSKL